MTIHTCGGKLCNFLIFEVTTSFGYSQAMDFSCQHLQGLLERLNKDKKLCTWTAHDNEFGQTTVSIRYKHPKPHSYTTTNSTREPSETHLPTQPKPQNDTRENQLNLSDTNRVSVMPTPTATSDTRVKPAETNANHADRTSESKQPSPINKIVFKPVSDYQLKRDKERLKDFKQSKYNTRASNKHSESVELKRDRDCTSSDSACQSPVLISPFADPNPFDLLVDTVSSPVIAETSLSSTKSEISEDSVDSKPHETSTQDMDMFFSNCSELIDKHLANAARNAGIKMKDDCSGVKIT